MLTNCEDIYGSLLARTSESCLRYNKTQSAEFSPRDVHGTLNWAIRDVPGSSLISPKLPSKLLNISLVFGPGPPSDVNAKPP